MAQYIAGAPIVEGRLGILPAAFNPPTVAHLALADAAALAAGLNQVVFCLPRLLPHKRFDGASFEQRVQMLRAAVGDPTLGRASRAAAISDQGLFLNVAREFRRLCGPDVELALICGADAAERIVDWDYSGGPSIEEQLEEYRMLVGSRGNAYVPPMDLQSRIECFDLPPEVASISSSDVRSGLDAGRVPVSVAELIERWGLYR